MFIAIRTAFYMSAFVFLWGWVALNVQRFDTRLGVVLPAWAQAPGAVLMAAGAMLVLACGVLFTAHGRGTPAPFDPPRQFVAFGPYRWVRNPIYVGGVTLLVGFGLWRQSSSILLLAVALALALHLFVLVVEEPGLERRFGENYLRYKRMINRWVPKGAPASLNHPGR
jgi:protein-S-isoprenylcysteine O-methyltransferase Ste14